MTHPHPTTHEVPTAAPRPQRKIGGHLSRLQGLIIILFALLILSVISIFLWQKFQNREEIARLLPTDRTIGFVELNLAQDTDAARLLQNKFAAQIEVAKSYIPSREIFEQYFTGRAGLAFLTSENGQQIMPVLMVKYNNYEKVQDWLGSLLLDTDRKSMTEESAYGQKLIGFTKGQQFYTLISGNFLIFSEDKNILTSIAKTTSGQSQSLYQDAQYSQIYSALPQQDLGFLYLDSAKLWQTLGKSPQFLDRKLAEFQQFYPFLKLFSAEAIALNAGIENGSPTLIARHLSAFNQASLPSPDFFQTDYYYTGNLDRYLPDHPLMAFGGSNLLDQKNKLSAYFKSSGELDDLLFSGSLKQLENYFKDNTPAGQDMLDIDRDFFPLFQGNYLLFFTNPDFSLILESAQPANDLQKLQKLLTQISKKLLSSTLTTVLNTDLPDGTKSAELIPSPPAETTPTTLQILDHPVTKTTLGPLSIFLSASSKTVLATTSESEMQRLLSLQTEATASVLSPSSFPRSTLQDKPTEVWTLDLPWLLSQITAPGSQLPIQPISLQGSRKFTEIGILSVYKIKF